MSQAQQQQIEQPEEQAEQSQQRPEAPPSDAMLQLILSFMNTQAIHVAAKLGIADLLTTGPKNSRELAAETHADARSLYRVLRALSSIGIFAEVEPEVFALTPLAETLRSDVAGSLRDTAVYMGEDWHLRPWGDITYSVQSGKPSFDHVFGLPVFPYLGQNPDAAHVFDRAMTSLSAAVVGAITAAYDFSGIERIADIAGGQGQLISAILKTNPRMKGILFDVPQVIEKAPALLLAEGVADRCELQTGDFFEAVPAGGSAYMMKHIIHDWDDASALKILENCHRVMRTGDKLLLIEMVVAPGNQPSPGKFLDLEMLLFTTGCERTEEQYRELYDRAGFRLTKITPTQSPYSVIEGVRR